MSLQMFMKIDGVTGSSKNYKYKGWMEVLSWNWGMTSNRKVIHNGADATTSLNELSVIKPVGMESPDIRLLFAQGKLIPEIEFCIIPVVAKRQAAEKYVDIKLEGILIKSIVTGGSVEDTFFKEHITLLFDKINFEYSQHEEPGDNVKSIHGTDFHFRWDVSANSEWVQP